MKTKETILKQIEDDVSKRAGIQLGERQRSMVESRLAKRMIDLHLKDLFEYASFFEANREEELKQLVSILTTHHTYFFREFSQFEYLTSGGMAQAIADARARPDKTIKFWSAACSRGHEVYSLATYLDFHMKQLAPDLSFSIYGTDIDHESVAYASNGVYRFSELAKIPKIYLDPYWVRGKGDIADFAKVKANVRSKCSFGILNLFEMDKELKSTKFDFIFCRNVFIYFSPEQIKQLTSNMMRHLTDNGCLFLGISESLNGMGLEVKSRGPSIYTHKKTETPKPSVAASATHSGSIPTITSTPTPIVAVPPALLRVMCVDDSMSIHTIMKRILTKENGFEIVATAMHGLEAAQKLKQHQIDVITLDIHMPEQDGIAYLRSNFSASHPPVVMVTSVSREDGNLASEALKLGASDFVEKPTLANFEKTGEEIRTKLKIAFKAKGQTTGSSSAQGSIEQAFKTKTITQTNAQGHRQLLLCSESDLKTVQAFLAETNALEPETLLVIDQGSAASMTSQLEKAGIKCTRNITTAAANQVSILDSASMISALRNQNGKRSTILVFKGFNAKLVEPLALLADTHFIFEDSPQFSLPASLKQASVDVMPATSFSYMSRLHLARKSA